MRWRDGWREAAAWSPTPGRIIVTAGVTGALSLLAQTLRERGITACAVEDPVADGNRHILDYWMDATTPVRVDEQAWA